MRIGIDVTFLFDQYANRGIGNYGRELTKLLVQDVNHTWILFGYGNIKDNLDALNIKKLPQIEFVSLGKKRLSNIFNIFYFKFFYLKKIIRAKLDLYFAPYFERGLPIGKVKTAVAVHDITPMITNSYSQKGAIFNFFKGIFYQFNVKKAKKADIIFTISDFTKRELIHKGNFDETKIRRIYLGVQEKFRADNISKSTREVRRVLVMYKITKPYILYYGGLENNKNVPNLLQAFSKITGRFPDLKLVLIGKEFKVGWDNKAHAMTKSAEKILEMIEDWKLKHKVILTGEVLEHHLPIIMNNALIFGHLSSYEGFGLAVLEALAAGTPVLAARRSCYPEVLIDGASLVNPFDVDKIALAMQELLQDENKTAKLIKRGYIVSDQYSWEKTAAATISEFNQMTKEVKPLKICYVSHYFYPIKGGAENNCLALARQMVKKGHQVTVLTTNTKDKKYLKIEEFEGIKIKRFTKLNQQYYLGFSPGLWWGLMKEKADVIHAHGFGFIWQDFCLLSKKIFSRRTKFINTPHGPFMARQKYRFPLKILRFTYFQIQKFFLNKVYHIVIQVNPLQYPKWIKKYGIREAKIKYLPNGIDPTIYHEVQLDPGKNVINLKRKFVISFIGRFEEYKGAQFLIQALPELLKLKSNIYLVVIGNSGNYLEAIQALISKLNLTKKISVLVTPEDSLKDYVLQQSEIFVMPSEWEAFGLGMLEAMAKSNAIITTRTEGGEFLIKEEENGYLFDFGDVPELVALISKLITNKALLTQIQKNNLEKSYKFNWEKIALDYQQILLELIK